MASVSTTVEDRASAVNRSSALTELTHRLAYGTPVGREQAARDLAGCGAEAVEVLLTHGLRDADRKVRTAATLSLLSLAAGSEIPLRTDSLKDLEAELLENVIRARSHGQTVVADLRTALNQRDSRRREAALRALEVLISGLADEEARRPFADLLIQSIEHKDCLVRLGVLNLLGSVPLPAAVPAILARLRRVRTRDNDLVGTLASGLNFVFAAFTILKLFTHAPSGPSDPLFWFRIGLLGALMVITPLMLAVRYRRKRHATAAELLGALRALECQEPALADGALKDLKSIASSASGHSVEARNHARKLIRQVEAVKHRHGPLPIPATGSETTDSLPVSVASD
jgi:hypothetical protein